MDAVIVHQRIGQQSKPDINHTPQKHATATHVTAAFHTVARTDITAPQPVQNQDVNVVRKQVLVRSQMA